jgi:hypothetical protein
VAAGKALTAFPPYDCCESYKKSRRGRILSGDSRMNCGFGPTSLPRTRSLVLTSPADLRSLSVQVDSGNPSLFDVAAARPSQTWASGNGTSHHGARRCTVGPKRQKRSDGLSVNHERYAIGSHLLPTFRVAYPPDLFCLFCQPACLLHVRTVHVKRFVPLSQRFMSELAYTSRSV